MALDAAQDWPDPGLRRSTGLVVAPCRRVAGGERLPRCFRDLVGCHVGRWDLWARSIGADPPRAVGRPWRPCRRPVLRPRNPRASRHALDYTARQCTKGWLRGA